MDVAQYTHTVTPVYYDYEPLLNFAEPMADVDCMVGVMDWILEDFKGAGAPKGCVMAYEASTSRQSDLPILYKLAEEKGIEWLPHVFYPFTATDYSTELAKVANEYEADYVYLRSPPSNSASIIKDAIRLGIKEDRTWIVCNFSAEPVMVDILGLENIAGVYAWNGHAGLVVESDQPGIQFAKELHDKYHPDVPWGNMYLYGMRMATIAQHTITATLERVGLENFSGSEIAETTWQIKDLDLGGNGPNLTMERGNMGLTHYGRLAMWHDDGEIYPESDWIAVPWLVGNPEVDWRA
jgi:hypothetical protein